MNGIQVPVTLKMAEPEANERARWLASEKRREMQRDIIMMYEFGRTHIRLGIHWDYDTDPFSTTAALMAKYGQREDDAAALLAAVEERWAPLEIDEGKRGVTEYPPRLKLLMINGIQVPVTLKMAEPEANQRARWLASEKRRKMQHEMIMMYECGRVHGCLAQPWDNDIDPFSTTAALMAKYGQSEEDTAALLFAVNHRWGASGFRNAEYGPTEYTPRPKRRKIAHTPVTPVVAPAIVPRAGCAVS